MKRKHVYIIAISLIVIFIAFRLYKKWQTDSMGYTQPQRQTIDSISDFAKKNNIPGELIVPVDTNAYDFLHQNFNMGMIYIFDRNKKVVQDNVSNHNGSCYSDIVKQLCNGADFSKIRIKDVNGPRLFDSLIRTSNFISGYRYSDTVAYDYIIVYGWAKYVKASYAPDLMKFGGCMSSSGKKVLILSVNNDFVDSWYPATEEVPELIIN